MPTAKAKIFPASTDGLGSLEDCREDQTLKSFDWDGGTLRFGLKNSTLQRGNQEAGELIAVALACKVTVLHGRSQTRRDRLAHLLEDLNYPLPDDFTVLARLGAKVADETSISPTVALKIANVSFDEGAQAL